MKYYGVTSSSMVAIGYNQETEVLVAQFNAETYYRYDGVPPELVATVMFSPSLGKAFNTLIKKGNFPYQKINGEVAAAL